jgi:hypothetical protein
MMRLSTELTTAMPAAELDMTGLRYESRSSLGTPGMFKSTPNVITAVRLAQRPAARPRVINEKVARVSARAKNQ